MELDGGWGPNGPPTGSGWPVAVRTTGAQAGIDSTHRVPEGTEGHPEGTERRRSSIGRGDGYERSGRR